MALNICCRWRTRYGMFFSIGLNVFLIMLLVKHYFHNNERIVSRRADQTQDVLSFATSRPNPRKVLNYFMFIVILSAPKGYERRKAIRETWLSLPIPKHMKIGHKFVIGTSGLDKELYLQLIEENKKQQDLLLLKTHQDSYHSLTIKLLKTFIWISNHIESNFVLKVDDDSFVRTKMLAKDLVAKQNIGRIYWGFFRGDSNVKKIGQWAEKKWILCDKYLPYANGGGYLLSQDLVDYIAKVSDMLQIYNNEDVAVGAWLAPVLMNRVHDVRFDTEYKSRGCSNKHVVSHKQSVADLYKKYHELTVNGRLCEEENVARLSFDYDWRVQPSKCCKRTKGIP